MSTSHLVSSFVELANCDKCIDAHAFIYFTWVPWMRMHLSGTTVVSTDPGDLKTLRNFSIPSRIVPTNRVTTISDVTKEVTVLNEFVKR